MKISCATNTCRILIICVYAHLQNSHNMCIRTHVVGKEVIPPAYLTYFVSFDPTMLISNLKYAFISIIGSNVHLSIHCR